MVAPSRHLIGIVGGSCAGKTWLANHLQTRLEGKAQKISLDDFYLDRTHLSPGRRILVNFDHPRAIDWPKVEEVLSGLLDGKRMTVPKYDFNTHARSGSSLELVPGPFILVEGLWLFRRPTLRKLFSLKIFVRSTKEWCEEQRVMRDTAERGRTRDQVRQQLERFTFPMYERFVAPQERWADVVLQSPIPLAQTEELAEKIQNLLGCEVVGI